MNDTFYYDSWYFIYRKATIKTITKNINVVQGVIKYKLVPVKHTASNLKK